MKLGDKIRDMLRTFLRIEPAQQQSFTIDEALDFWGTAFMHRLWYRGSPHELNQFYEQLDDDTCAFWGSASTSGLEIRKIHTGIPKEICKMLADIVVRDLNNIRLDKEELQDTWDSINRENKLPRLFKRAIRDTCVVGDGAFKLSLDLDVSQYPIIEWYPGDKVEFVCTRGRVTEVIFINRYEHKHHRYTLREHYGRGYVRYELLDGEKEVDIDALEETQGLKNVMFDPTWMMAVPFEVQESDRWPGRGESIFEGKEGNFDALDEAWSQWVHAMRDARPKKYIPENLIPRNENNGALLKPNPFDNQFIRVESDMRESANNQIQLIQAAFNSGEYSATLNSALDFALQGLISPSTLGIDVKKMDNAEAQREKEKATLYSRNNIINAFSEALSQLVNVALKTYYTAKKQSIEDIDVEITFGEYANPSFEAVVEIMSNPNTPMSIEAKVDELWGDTKDDIWKSEEVNRIKEQQGVVTVDEPGVGVKPVLPDGMING